MRKAFYYKNYEFDAKSGVLKLLYESMGHEFAETITFEGAPFHLTPVQKKALDLIFFYAHIAFGISYYKAFLNPAVIIQSGRLNDKEAAFFEKFYLNGLGEFSVKNNVDIQIAFPFEHFERDRFNLDLKDRTLVPVGGGKDSCVTAELLKNAHHPITAISLGNPRPIANCVRAGGLGHIVMTRQIAPALLRLNEAGGVFNGHVPITGLISFLLWAAAVLYDYKYVAMSCERSANSGNMIKNGRAINHQYSKSLEYERDFYALTGAVQPEFRYFSLLRPFSEAHIAKMFASFCTPYFDVFTSCNKAFKLDETKRLNHWCGACDKCRFVFLILAPFIDKAKLIQIVGANLLDDETQLKGFEELLALSGHKPFECVGEANECRWAIKQLSKNPKWQQDVLIRMLVEKIESNESDIFIPSSNHLIPEEFQNVIR